MQRPPVGRILNNPRPHPRDPPPRHPRRRPLQVVRVLPIQYPSSEIYYYKPLNERVPVFQKPFRLVQELVLDGSLAGQAALRGKENVTVKGMLEYQACNDRECFNPVSVPLSWTMTLRPLVIQRPNAQQKQP